MSSAVPSHRRLRRNRATTMLRVVNRVRGRSEAASVPWLRATRGVKGSTIGAKNRGRPVASNSAAVHPDADTSGRTANGGTKLAQAVANSRFEEAVASTSKSSGFVKDQGQWVKTVEEEITREGIVDLRTGTTWAGSVLRRIPLILIATGVGISATLAYVKYYVHGEELRIPSITSLGLAKSFTSTSSEPKLREGALPSELWRDTGGHDDEEHDSLPCTSLSSSSSSAASAESPEPGQSFGSAGALFDGNGRLKRRLTPS